jgi:hypothetical protein
MREWMPIVNYGKYRVSDERLRDVLEKIADETSRVVRLTSGDRNFVPKGGSPRSLHLINEAVDFHIEGLSDEQAFTLIRMKRREIFGDMRGKAFRFQIIRHGVNTETQGTHIHLGYVPEGVKGNSVVFLVEGLTPSGKGRYTMVEGP